MWVFPAGLVWVGGWVGGAWVIEGDGRRRWVREERDWYGTVAGGFPSFLYFFNAASSISLFIHW